MQKKGKDGEIAGAERCIAACKQLCVALARVHTGLLALLETLCTLRLSSRRGFAQLTVLYLHLSWGTAECNPSPFARSDRVIALVKLEASSRRREDAHTCSALRLSCTTSHSGATCGSRDSSATFSTTMLL